MRVRARRIRRAPRRAKPREPSSTRTQSYTNRAIVCREPGRRRQRSHGRLINGPRPCRSVDSRCMEGCGRCSRTMAQTLMGRGFAPLKRGAENSYSHLWRTLWIKNEARRKTRLCWLRERFSIVAMTRPDGPPIASNALFDRRTRTSNACPAWSCDSQPKTYAHHAHIGCAFVYKKTAQTLEE